jgi:hypothetical protein
MTRRTLALCGLLALVALAGCSSVFGPGEPDSARLNANASYDWEANHTAELTVNRSSYTAVYNVPNNTSMGVYVRDDLGRDRHVPIEALRYRYPNGSVITSNQTALNVSQTRKRTTIDLPNASGGAVAYTAPRHGKQFSLPVFIPGNYSVRLPQSARVGVPFLSNVSPRNYTTSVNGSYMTVGFPELTDRSMHIRWYLQRDLFIFTILLILALAIGSGGAIYYYRQIQRLRERREQTDLDVDIEDDSGRGPPPGMR